MDARSCSDSYVLAGCHLSLDGRVGHSTTEGEGESSDPVELPPTIFNLDREPLIKPLTYFLRDIWNEVSIIDHKGEFDSVKRRALSSTPHGKGMPEKLL